MHAEPEELVICPLVCWYEGVSRLVQHSTSLHATGHPCVSFLHMSTLVPRCVYACRLLYCRTTFNRAAGSGTVTGVATSNGKVALLATIDAGGQAFTTPGALQASSSAASEASVYLAVLDVAANYPALG